MWFDPRQSNKYKFKWTCDLTHSRSNDVLQCTCEAYMENTCCIGKTKNMSKYHQPFLCHCLYLGYIRIFFTVKKYKKRYKFWKVHRNFSLEREPTKFRWQPNFLELWNGNIISSMPCYFTQGIWISNWHFIPRESPTIIYEMNRIPYYTLNNLSLKKWSVTHLSRSDLEREVVWYGRMQLYILFSTVLVVFNLMRLSVLTRTGASPKN
jgi:hypothetical protein